MKLLLAIFSLIIILIPNLSFAAVSRNSVIDGCIVSFSIVNEDGTQVSSTTLDPAKTYYASFTIDIVKSGPSTCLWNQNVYEFGYWELVSGKYVKSPINCHAWSEFKDGNKGLKYVTDKLSSTVNNKAQVYFRLGLDFNSAGQKNNPSPSCAANVGSVITDYGNTALFLSAQWSESSKSTSGNQTSDSSQNSQNSTQGDQALEVNSDVEFRGIKNFDEKIGQFFNPLDFDSAEGLVVGIINLLLLIVGSLSVLFIIFGGFQMVTAAGNDTRLTQGKKTVQWAVLGLILSVMSFSIVAIISSIIS